MRKPIRLCSLGNWGRKSLQIKTPTVCQVIPELGNFTGENTYKCHSAQNIVLVWKQELRSKWKEVFGEHGIRIPQLDRPRLSSGTPFPVESCGILQWRQEQNNPPEQEEPRGHLENEWYGNGCTSPINSASWESVWTSHGSEKTCLRCLTHKRTKSITCTRFWGVQPPTLKSKIKGEKRKCRRCSSNF